MKRYFLRPITRKIYDLNQVKYQIVYVVRAERKPRDFVGVRATNAGREARW